MKDVAAIIIMAVFIICLSFIVRAQDLTISNGWTVLSDSSVITCCATEGTTPKWETMGKYTISWALFEEQMCTPDPPKPDEFGRISPVNITLAAYCRKRVFKETKSRSFDDKKEADKFLERLKIACKEDFVFKAIDSIRTNYE